MADAYPSALRYAPIGSPDHEHQPPESEYLSLHIPTRFYSRCKITAFFGNMQILFQKYPFFGRMTGSQVECFTFMTVENRNRHLNGEICLGE